MNQVSYQIFVMSRIFLDSLNGSLEFSINMHVVTYVEGLLAGV